MEHPEYLPLGSVCLVEGSDKELMIIGRGLLVLEDMASDKFTFFDYGACLYPEGLVGDQVIYMNHDAVRKVLYRGYETASDEVYIDHLKDSTKNIDIPRRTPEPFAAIAFQESQYVQQG